MVVEVLEQLIEYRLKWKKDGKNNYVDGTVIRFVRHSTWTGSEMSTMGTGVGRSRRAQILFSAISGRYLRLAVAGISKVACKAVKDGHAA